MARKIRLDPQSIEEIAENLKTMRLLDPIKIEPPKDDRKAVVLFTPLAWTKMYALVDEFPKEVQWHGIVSRLNESSFLIEDIIIFPHEATSTTVVSEQEEYEEWLNELPDSVFNACRFHGHSHVNMHVSPSPTDLKYRKDVVDNFSTKPSEDEDQFYIFLIVNKRREFSGQIYDLTQNALYESADLIVDVVTNGALLKEFTDKAKQIVKDPAPKYQPPTQKDFKGSENKQTSISSPQGTSVSSIPPKPTYPRIEETTEEWEERIYGGGKYDSVDKQFKYPKEGFRG